MRSEKGAGTTKEFLPNGRATLAWRWTAFDRALFSCGLDAWCDAYYYSILTTGIAEASIQYVKRPGAW